MGGGRVLRNLAAPCVAEGSVHIPVPELRFAEIGNKGFDLCRSVKTSPIKNPGKVGGGADMTAVMQAALIARGTTGAGSPWP
jgi:hypothetical protein